MANPKEFVLCIQNNTAGVGWITGCTLHKQTTWNREQPLRDDLPISTRASMQGMVDFSGVPTPGDEVWMSVLTVFFDRVPGTMRSGVVLVQFGVQLVNEKENIVMPLLGATESTPWLVPRVDTFTDDKTAIGWVTIDVLKGPLALIQARW